ncbi:MAG: STAS domain-containing protein [Nocardioides sp.]|nr:STAS domain-containing protein [Nocardioides sp.]
MQTSRSVTMAVTGDLDLEGALRLRESVCRQLAGDVPADLTMDLTDVRFIDAAGIGALMWTRRRLKDSGGTLVLSGSNEGVARLLQPLGLAAMLSGSRILA